MLEWRETTGYCNQVHWMLLDDGHTVGRVEGNMADGYDGLVRINNLTFGATRLDIHARRAWTVKRAVEQAYMATWDEQEAN